MIYVLFGFDIEGVHGSHPFEQLILGKTKASISNRNEFGALYLAETFSKYGFEATFFIDTIERLLHGEDKMSDLCMKLCDFHQDVQLHTHPSWRHDERDSDKLNNLKRRLLPDQKKDFLYKLTAKEQISFIKQEKHALEGWTGQKVQAHRAGGYGIDNNTLESLLVNDIRLDSSVYGHSNCKYSPKFGWNDGVFEFPLSSLAINNSKLARVDIDYVTSCQIINAIDEFSGKNEDIDLCINVFGHSYSLLSFTNDFSSIKPSRYRINNLNKLLDGLKDRSHVEVVSYSQLLNGAIRDNKKLLSKTLDCNKKPPLLARIANSSRIKKNKIVHSFFPFIL